MLRINLLPPYIYDKQKKIRLLAVWVVVWILVVVGVLAWHTNLNNQLAEVQKNLDNAQTQKGLYDKAVSAIDESNRRSADTRVKQTFVKDARAFNDAWPQLYTMMRDLTSPSVLLKQMYVEKDLRTVKFAGFSKTEREVMQWWIALRNTKGVFSNVFFNLPAHSWLVQDQNASSGGQSGPGGFGGPGSYGSYGGPSAYGGPGSPSGFTAPDVPGGRGAGGGGGFTSPGSSSDNEYFGVGSQIIEGRYGVKFTAVVVLIQPIAPSVPSWPVGNAGGEGPNGGPGAPSPYGGPGSFGPGPGGPGGPVEGRPMSGRARGGE